MKKLFLALGASLFAAVGLMAAEATVVRVHPWLTRGVDREALAGLKFTNGYGGAMNQVTFKFELKNCTKADLSNFQLWTQPSSTSGSIFYASTATQLNAASPIMTTTVSDEADGAFSVTFANANYASVTENNRAVGWVFKDDRIWLTATINSEIRSDAEILVTVAESTVNLGSNVYTIVDTATPRTHQVYPYLYRIGAYIVADRVDGANALYPNRKDVFNDATDKRIAALTDVTLIDTFPIYNAESDSFELSWDRKGWGAAISRPIGDTEALQRMKDLRAAHHPGMRIHFSLTKQGRIWTEGNKTAGVTATNTYTLDSMGTGSSYVASPLGHATGSKYRAKFIDAILALMAEQGLDGMDIDWEYPNTHADTSATLSYGEMEKYALFVQELAENFFEHGYELAICSNLGWQMPGAQTFAAVDFVNSMAYGGNPLNASNAVMSTGISVCTEKGVHKRRIVVGQAIYSNANYHPGWDALLKVVVANNEPGWPRWEKDLYHGEYWTNGGRSGDGYSFMGPMTYRAKCARVPVEGLGGVMSWGYYTDGTAAQGYWDGEEMMALGMHQAQVLWPHDTWATPEQDVDGFYLLKGEEDWFWFQQHPGNNVRLAADITFEHDPLPISSFGGTFDGANHTLTLPRTVWILSVDDAALFVACTGTIKDLNLVVEGCIVSRRDRKIDAGAANNFSSLSTKGGEGAFAAALVAKLNGGAVLENVHLTLAEGSLVRGQHEVGGLVAQVYAGGTATIKINNCSVSLAGTLSTAATDSLENGVTMTSSRNGDIGALIGQLNYTSTATMRVTNNAVTLAPTAKIESVRGQYGGAGGCIGNCNPVFTATEISNLTLNYDSNATITSDFGQPRCYQPWIADGRGKADKPTLNGTIFTTGTWSWNADTLWLQTPVLRSILSTNNGTLAPQALQPIADSIASASGMSGVTTITLTAGSEKVPLTTDAFEGYLGCFTDAASTAQVTIVADPDNAANAFANLQQYAFGITKASVNPDDPTELMFVASVYLPEKATATPRMTSGSTIELFDLDTGMAVEGSSIVTLESHQNDVVLSAPIANVKGRRIKARIRK